MFLSTGGPFSGRLRQADLGAFRPTRWGIDRGPPVANLALALAPWLARRALKEEKIEPVSRVPPLDPRGRAGDVKPALHETSSKKKGSVDPIHLPYE